MTFDKSIMAESGFALAGGVKAEIPMFASTFLEFDIRYRHCVTRWIDTDEIALDLRNIYLSIGYGFKF